MDPDAPIIVPRPGQILRRAVRTKIRKSSLNSDTGRSGARRRGATSGSGTNSPSEAESWAESGQRRRIGSDDYTSGDAFEDAAERRQSDQSGSSGDADGDEGGQETSYSSSRPVSDEATDSIVDAYNRDSYLSEASQRSSVTSVSPADEKDSNLVGESLEGSSSRRSRNRNESRDATQRSMSPTSPPVTPTQATASSRGGPSYFDIEKEKSQRSATVASNSTTSTSSGGVSSSSPQLAPFLFESPSQSPEAEYQPGPNQIRPIPVSHVPPVPSFEKTRPAPQPPTHSSTAPAAPRSRMPESPSSVGNGYRNQSSSSSAGLEKGFVPGPIPRKELRPSSPPAKASSKEKKGGFGLGWLGIGRDDEDSSRGDEKKKEKLEKREKREKERGKEEERERERERERHMEKEKERERERDREREREREKEREKEKDSSSFLGALFGSKKKAQDDGPQGNYNRNNSHIQAGSLLDRAHGGGKGGAVNYYRYPIHVERAVYRLSHIKLANPRRPLYEQVLISNLMFWYLSIINRPQQPPPPQQQPTQSPPPPSNQPEATNLSIMDDTSAAAAYASLSTDSTPRVEIDPSPNSSSSGPKSYPSTSQQAAASSKGRKTGLVKPNRAPANSGRSAETPILAAGYGQQHRQIDRALSNGPIAVQNTAFSVGQVIDPKILQQQQFVSPSPYGGDTVDYRDSSSNRSNAKPKSTSNASSPEGDPYEYNYYASGDDYVNGNGSGTSSGMVSNKDERSYGGSDGYSSQQDQQLTSPQTSPGMSPQRIMRSSAPVQGSDGLKGRERERDNRASSPVDGEHAWLGGGGGNSSSNSRSVSPNSAQRISDPTNHYSRSNGMKDPTSNSSSSSSSSRSTSHRTQRSMSPPTVGNLSIGGLDSQAMLQAAQSSQSRRR